MTAKTAAIRHQHGGASLIPSSTGGGGKGVIWLPAVHVWADTMPPKVDRISATEQRRIDSANRDIFGAGRQVGAVWVSSDSGIDCLSVTTAAQTGRRAAGPLLLAVQGQLDLAMVGGMARKLGSRMRSESGARGKVSDTTIDDATGAGVLRLAQWRDINSRFPLRRVRSWAGRVAWVSVVRDISRDDLGESLAVSVHDLSCEYLAGSVVPLPQFSGDDSRQDKAARLRFERVRAARPNLLPAVVAGIKARGGRGKRAELVDKIGRAARLLLQGMTLDKAAQAAGFKAYGRTRAGDSMAVAVRRLGGKFRMSLRQSTEDAKTRQAALVTMSTATANCLLPSPLLPLVVVNPRVAKRHAKRQAAGKARQARQAQRAFAKSGLWSGGVLSGNVPHYRKSSGEQHSAMMRAKRHASKQRQFRLAAYKPLPPVNPFPCHF